MFLFSLLLSPCILQAFRFSPVLIMLSTFLTDILRITAYPTLALGYLALNSECNTIDFPPTGETKFLDNMSGFRP